MRFRAILTVLQTVSLGILGACSAGPKNAASDAATSLPSGFELVLGEGGGVIGGWTGHTIAADGSVSTWSGPVAEAGLKPIGRLDPDQVSSIWTGLQDIGVDTLTTDERGEVTAFVTVRTDSSTHRVSWIPGVEGIEDPRYPIETLYRDIRKAAVAASESQ